MVQVIGPTGLETVLINRDGAFSNQLGWDPLIGPFFDRGVMLMDFEEHRHHRRIMQQAFKHDRLVGYLERMNPAIERASRAGGPAEASSSIARPSSSRSTCHRGVRRGRARPRVRSLERAFIDAVVGGTAMIRSRCAGRQWQRGLERRR